MENRLENLYSEGKSTINTEFKRHIYDIISAVIVLAIIAASLNAIGLIDLTGEDARQQFVQFIVEWVPYFMASILLNSNLYQKGVFVAKSTTIYKGTAAEYTKIVNNLTGDQIKKLYDFCNKYNENAIRSIQEQILKKEGLVMSDFDLTYKSSTKSSLKTLGLTSLQIKAICKAKRVKVKGLNINMLLSSINIKDPTNLGYNENELAKRQSVISTAMYFFSTMFMSLIAIKDITEWGWTGIIIVIFKVSYVFARCYMSYFKGYNDITVLLTSHIGRKTDILKMYLEDYTKILSNNVSN